MGERRVQPPRVDGTCGEAASLVGVAAEPCWTRGDVGGDDAGRVDGGERERGRESYELLSELPPPLLDGGCKRAGRVDERLAAAAARCRDGEARRGEGGRGRRGAHEMRCVEPLPPRAAVVVARVRRSGPPSPHEVRCGRAEAGEAAEWLLPSATDGLAEWAWARGRSPLGEAAGARGEAEQSRGEADEPMGVAAEWTEVPLMAARLPALP